MKLWQANLGRGVDVAEFKLNMRRVLNAGGRRAVFAFQEIDEADRPEEHEYLRWLVRDTHTIFGALTAVPILVPKHLEVVATRVTHGCDGLAKFTPNRPIVEVTVRLPSGLEVSGHNFHLPINRPQTAGRRADVRRAVRSRVETNRRLGRAGWWTADTNTHIGWPTMARGERPAIEAGIDKAKAWAPDGREVRVTDRRTVDLTIDGHDAHGCDIRWPKARS